LTIVSTSQRPIFGTTLMAALLATPEDENGLELNTPDL
jgi:hypothetical protein